MHVSPRALSCKACACQGHTAGKKQGQAIHQGCSTQARQTGRAQPPLLRAGCQHAAAAAAAAAACRTEPPVPPPLHRSCCTLWPPLAETAARQLATQAHSSEPQRHRVLASHLFMLRTGGLGRGQSCTAPLSRCVCECMPCTWRAAEVRTCSWSAWKAWRTGRSASRTTTFPLSGINSYAVWLCRKSAIFFRVYSCAARHVFLACATQSLLARDVRQVPPTTPPGPTGHGRHSLGCGGGPGHLMRHVCSSRDETAGQSIGALMCICRALQTKPCNVKAADTDNEQSLVTTARMAQHVSKQHS